MKNKELSLEEQVERIRRKRNRHLDNAKTRMVLNTLFLIMAAVGLVLYFWNGEHHVAALIVIGIGMLFKIVEFVLRLI